ncbi:hypothetical protein ACHWQZ_G014734 [Mnemiopsis leidyi]
MSEHLITSISYLNGFDQSSVCFQFQFWKSVLANCTLNEIADDVLLTFSMGMDYLVLRRSSGCLSPGLSNVYSFTPYSSKCIPDVYSHLKAEHARLFGVSKSVKEAVKAVNEEEERSKNLIVYGAQDDDESEWGYSCKVDKTTDTFTAICDQLECENVDVQHCTRIGEWRADRTRPIKVEFRTAADVETVLRKAHKLKASDEFKKVYLAPDRSAEERAAHSKLVNQMKELIKKDNSKHYFIRDDKIKCTDKK